MSEKKTYITQPQDHGAVLISEEVVSAIVAHTVMEVEGVLGVGFKPGAERKSWSKGIFIRINEREELIINCHLLMAYGNSVVTVAQAAQAAICTAVENMTGIKPKSVNVNISGIVRE